MCGHGFARPQRTDFLRCVIADCEDEIERGGTRLRELIPRLAPEALNAQTRILNLFEGLRPHRTGRVTSGTVRGEGRHTFSFHDRLGHDRTCGISCAEEQYVVMWHCSISFRRPAKRKHCAVTPWLRAVGEANDGALDCFHKLRWKLVFILKERVTKTV